MRCAIALGSNLGDRLANLSRARDAVIGFPSAGRPLLQSAVYQTAPVDCEVDAPDFYNAVAEIELSSETGPETFLAHLQSVERDLGRPPACGREPNAPRAIDLDILYIDGLSLQTPALTLPHPRLHERRFVLQPLDDIRPDFILPDRDRSIADLLRDLDSTEPPLTLITRDW